MITSFAEQHRIVVVLSFVHICERENRFFGRLGFCVQSELEVRELRIFQSLDWHRNRLYLIESTDDLQG